ncbi:MAG: DUF4136 domain-containing protein [candidate division KSB1 bacterium]|nr:DUF4136 domain-containing protein [candidate division KSB1 bacterium]
MKSIALFLLPLLFTISCSGVRVAVNYDQGVDFSEYATYTFAEPRQNKAGTRHFITKSILLEIDPLLKEKGLQKSDPKRADLTVHFYTLVKNQRQFISPSYRVDRWGRVWQRRPGHVRKYKQGTLVIDIVDRRKKELVWQGVGSGILNPNDPQEHFLDAVREILKDFPPA